MNILHINTHISGGAAQACLSIHRELLDLGVASHLLVGVRGGDTDLPYTRIYDTVEGTLNRGILEFKELLYKTRRNYLLSRLPASQTWFSFPWSPYDLMRTEAYKKADIIHLHWVGEFIDYKSFFKKNKKPIIWTLHDLNPVTGGEHSEIGFFYEEFKSLCQKTTKLKRKALAGQPITWVAPSLLHQERSKKFPLFNQFPNTCIPNGVATNVFKLRDQQKIRAILDLPQDQKIAFFLAYPDDYTRKGMLLMRQVMRAMEAEDLLFIAIGHTDVSMHKNCLALGHASDPLLMAQYYGAADYLISPSLEESFGLTILESLACGTPVVGFSVGCIPEVILEGENGWIAPEKTEDSLLYTLKKALKSKPKQSRGIIASQAVNYDWKRRTVQYLDLYKTVINNQT